MFRFVNRENSELLIVTQKECMANNLEKRLSNRRSTEGSISLFSKVWMFKKNQGRLLNISERGICFTTDKKLVPGTTFLCKRINGDCFDPDSGEGCRLNTNNVLTVKWCQEGSHKNQDLYTIGANIRPPH